VTFASIKALADAKASEVVMFAAKSHSKRSPSGLAMRVVLGTLRVVLGTSHVRDLAVPAWRERCTYLRAVLVGSARKQRTSKFTKRLLCR
jgi:hypothetical protein